MQFQFFISMVMGLTPSSDGFGMKETEDRYTKFVMSFNNIQIFIQAQKVEQSASFTVNTVHLIQLGI